MTRTTMTFWVFSSHQKSSPVGIRCPLPFPPTSPRVQPQATPSLLSASVLDISYKKDNTTCVLFLLASFIWNTVLKLHLWGGIYLHFTFIAEWYSPLWIYHIEFVHLSVDGLWWYCYVLAIINNGAMNICV